MYFKQILHITTLSLGFTSSLTPAQVKAEIQDSPFSVKDLTEPCAHNPYHNLEGEPLSYDQLKFSLSHAFNTAVPKELGKATHLINECNVFSAARLGDSCSIYELYSSDSKSINYKDQYGNTPLHYAAYNGDFKTVEFLVNLGANVDLQNNNGESALHYLIVGLDHNKHNLFGLKGYKPTIEFLTANSNFDLVTKTGESIKDYVEKCLSTSTLNLLAQYCYGFFDNMFPQLNSDDPIKTLGDAAYQD